MHEHREMTLTPYLQGEALGDTAREGTNTFLALLASSQLLADQIERFSRTFPHPHLQK